MDMKVYQILKERLDLLIAAGGWLNTAQVDARIAAKASSQAILYGTEDPPDPTGYADGSLYVRYK